jgi:Major Facilitator Superfamily
MTDAADIAPVSRTGIALGLRENWQQFALLVLINAFVGGMVGLERTLVPLIGSETFRLASTAAITSFIVSFGVVKAVTNLVSGQLADSWGRKNTLVLGWAVGLPVPFLIMWAPAWGWIVAANVLLGVNQGLSWSMTVIMKVDLVGPRQRGLAVGLNEFAGYLAVGLTAFLTGYLATLYGLRPAPFYLGIGYAAAGLLLSAWLVRDTREHVALERRQHPRVESSLNFGDVFLRTSLTDRTLFAASQAGLVNNLNDGMSSAVLCRCGSERRTHRHSQGCLSGHLGHFTGGDRTAERPLGAQGADRYGDVGAGGRVVCGRRPPRVRLVVPRQRPARVGDGNGLSVSAGGSLRRGRSFLARPGPQRLPLLARSRLRDRGARSRVARRHHGIGLDHRRDRRAHICFRDPRGWADARPAALIRV